MTSSVLMQPLKVGDLDLKNRVAMAPLTRSRAGSDRLPNALMAEYYRQRASAGLIFSEATAISEQALGWLNSPGIYTEAQTEAWKQVTQAVHDRGGKIFLQMWHCGRASHSSFRADRSLPVAPSPLAITGDSIHTPEGKQEYEVPRPLAESEIPAVVEDYRRAADRAKQAGFDGVEIHAANGYLIDQFLQSVSNQRQDSYGGSIEARYRFLGEIIAAVQTVWPNDRISVRLAPNGSFNGMGSIDFRETFTYVVQQIAAAGIGLLHVMDGLAFGFHGHGEPVTLAELRPHFPGVLIGNCGYDQGTAETAIATGQADVIAFGRPYIANPDLVERFAQGWPLAPLPDMADWYAFGAKGYADFPAYAENQAS